VNWLQERLHVPVHSKPLSSEECKLYADKARKLFEGTSSEYGLVKWVKADVKGIERKCVELTALNRQLSREMAVEGCRIKNAVSNPFLSWFLDDARSGYHVESSVNEVDWQETLGRWADYIAVESSVQDVEQKIQLMRDGLAEADGHGMDGMDGQGCGHGLCKRLGGMIKEMMKEMAHKAAPEAEPYTSEAFVGAFTAMEAEETSNEGGAS